MATEAKSLAEELGNPHDTFFKSLLGRRSLAVEFLRYYLPEDVTAGFDLRTVEEVKDSFISEELRKYFSDLIFRVKLKSGEDVYVYILLEHKSAPEKWVALQLLGYKVKLWERIKASGARLLPLVVPVIFYHGRRRWNVAPSFGALVKGAEREELRQFIPDFEYYLCDLSRYTDDEIVGSDELQTGFLLMKYIFRREFGQRWGEIISNLNTLPDEQMKENLKPIVRYVSAAAPGLTPRRIEEKLREAFPKKVGGVMQTAAEIWMQQGLQQGLQQGEEKTRVEFAEMAIRLLARKLGQISARAEKQIRRLPLPALKKLADALLDFEKPADLTAWLRGHSPKRKS